MRLGTWKPNNHGASGHDDDEDDDDPAKKTATIAASKTNTAFIINLKVNGC